MKNPNIYQQIAALHTHPAVAVQRAIIVEGTVSGQRLFTAAVDLCLTIGTTPYVALKVFDFDALQRKEAVRMLATGAYDSPKQQAALQQLEKIQALSVTS